MSILSPDDYFVFLNTWKVLVCRPCQYGLQKNGVEKHLIREHQAIPLAIRKDLIVYTETLTLLSPSEVLTPSTFPPIQAFDCLKQFNEGRQCIQCKAVCGTLSSMEAHCRDKHEWVKSKGLDDS